jgi:hypothetical protein
MIYVRMPIEVDACQFLGHEKHFELAGVDLIKMDGVGGYARKLAYVKDNVGNMITVRPKDYVFMTAEGVRVMAEREFEDEYELKSRLNQAKQSVKQ